MVMKPLKTGAVEAALAMILAASASPAMAAEPRCGPIGSTDNFRSHHDNFMLLNQMRNNGWAGRDEAAVRVQYSFKYSIYGCPGRAGLTPERLVSASSLDSEVFLAYTGQFDFYMGTRDSGPVINRLSMPGIHWRLPLQFLRAQTADTTSVVLSLEHRSDGQVFEPTKGTGPAQTQLAYAQKDRALFDTISRGSNYVGLTAQTDVSLGGRTVGLVGIWRGYLSQDSQVTWGPLAGRGYSIADHDRVWLRASTQADGIGLFDVAWRVGDAMFKTDSFDIGWQAPPKLGLPWYVRAHVGPMNTLSNYTQRQDSLGVGLRFSDF